MNIELLQQLCEASAVSGDEQEVRTLLINALDSSVDEITLTASAALSHARATVGRRLPSLVTWMKWALWSRISTKAAFCASPPLAVGGASRC